MAKVTTYENSKFATFLSFLGYLGIVLGVYCLFEDDFEISVGIIMLVISFALKFLANLIGNRKAKKKAQNSQAK